MSRDRLGAPRFKGRVAIVTGAGRGMGQAVAAALVDEGASVVLADRDGEAVTRAATSLGGTTGRAHAVVADIARSADVKRLFEETLQRFSGLDILVNNAGFGVSKPLLEYDEDDWDRQMATNLKGTFFCTQAAARIMVPNRRGKIVNFASTSAFVSSAAIRAVAYDTSKGGVRQLTVSAAAELAPYGINVNAIAPGTILTDATRRALNTEERMAIAAAKIPLGRLGTPDDIVGPTLFLCSTESDYVTGHTLVVDGGWLLL